MMIAAGLLHLAAWRIERGPEKKTNPGIGTITRATIYQAFAPGLRNKQK